MIPLLKSIRRNGLASPYGPVLVACLGFLVAWLFPPRPYTYYMNEPDRMFLDLLTFIYFFACVAAFLLGLRVNRMANPAAWRAVLPKAYSPSPILYLAIPYTAAMVFCALALRIIGSHVNFLMILAAHQGEELKNMGKEGARLSSGEWVQAPMLLIGVLWWMQLRVQQLRLSRGTRVVFMLVWFLGVLLAIATTVATVNRSDLMSLLAGCGLIWIFGKEARGVLRVGRGLLYGAAGFVSLVAVFMSISFLRGASAANLLISNLLGYSIACYNRLASLLHGSMTLFFGGRGIYLFIYLQDADRLNKIFHFQEALHWPPFYLRWGAEFSSVALAGLNVSYNWVSVFGFLYADIGWGAIIYVFGAGILAGMAWSNFRRGSALAATVYPWIAVWILIWSGPNVLFDAAFVHLVLVGLLLAGWDKLLMVNRLDSEPSSAAIETRDTGGRALPVGV